MSHASSAGARARARGPGARRPRPSAAAASCSTSVLIWSIRRCACSGRFATSTGRWPPVAAARPTTTRSSPCATSRASRATCGRRRSPPLPARGCGCSAARALTWSMGSTARRPRSPPGERPRPGEPWGREPPQRWGRLVVGDASEPVPSEPGDWPRFYAELEAALRGERPAAGRSRRRGHRARAVGTRPPQPGPSLDLARAVSSVGRALPLQGRGRRFEPGTAHLTQSNSGRCRPEAHQSRRRVETVALYSVFNPSAGARATSSLASRFATRSPG